VRRVHQRLGLRIAVTVALALPFSMHPTFCARDVFLCLLECRNGRHCHSRKSDSVLNDVRILANSILTQIGLSIHWRQRALYDS
jgi:hypothetical protein